MNAPTPVTSIQLAYVEEEDRIVIIFDLAPGQRYGMGLTRRITGRFIDALASMQANRRTQELGGNVLLRDTILSFEHSQAVAQGLASGDASLKRPLQAPTAAPRLVREIKLVPGAEGSLAVSLDDRQQVLAVELQAQRVHSLIAGLVDLAARGDWNLPTASWLDRSDSSAPAPATAVIH